MKWFTILIIFIGVAELFAGGKQSKLEYDSVAQGPKETSTSFITYKPFGGKKWKNVHIADDTSVYSFYGNSLKKWDFKGIEEIDCGDDLQDMPKHACKTFLPTDGCCYWADGNTVVRYPMNSGLKKSEIPMKKMIKALVANKGEFAVLTEDNLVTFFDSESNVIGIPFKLENERGDYINEIGLLERGEFFVKSKLKIRFYNSKSRKYISDIEKIGFKKILRKKTLDGYFCVACDHPTIKNRSDIRFYGKGDEDCEKAITTIHPREWDLDGNTLVIAGGKNGQPSPIKLYDVTTGQKTYEDTTDISGECAIRLLGNEVYFVGNEPEPRSIIIDTREKSRGETEQSPAQEGDLVSFTE